MHPLDGPRLKITRVKSEIQRLRGVEEIFRQNTHYNVVRAEFNANIGKYVYRLSIVGNSPSLEWGVYIGEIAHNLRSALDGLVWQLALQKTKTPATNTQFPIFLVGRTKKRTHGNRGEFIHSFEGRRRGDGRDMIRSLFMKHQTMIERLQPYKRGNSPHWQSRIKRHNSYSNPLWWLHKINNADKHRLIQVVGAKRGAGPVVVARDDTSFNNILWFNPTVLKNGTKICEAPSDVSVDPYISPLISFANSCEPVRGIGVLFVLNRIVSRVSDIIESFVNEF